MSGLLSWTLSRVLWLSGFSEYGAAWQPRIMEEKALEVYGNLSRALFDVYGEGVEEGLTFGLEWTLGVFARPRGKRVLPGPKSHSNVGLERN